MIFESCTETLIPIYHCHSCRYLLANPGDIGFFPKFSSAGVGAQLRSNEAFQTQTHTVMEFLTKVVENLGDLDAAGKMLRERVRSHHPRGITMAQFEVGVCITDLHFVGFGGVWGGYRSFDGSMVGMCCYSTLQYQCET